ncbi:LysE family transporter [Aneurinibacillus sp. Ricciae_BoGa-3]|uniref:LysE family transporter n=1 Tax=Aneurinibacillus sp. Ricciae_BoGa-3 TaxID=3022697 RepID=UPI00234285DD|nr:LysE family transporter [Aneurinibacillus sp. Ricciae_BoGa-3]WCK54906.1 LysE family transporter [Aneurinibacillus sp. Ricciae_BoGa-3]
MNIAAFLSYVLVTTFTPGPNNIMSMSNANKYGFRKTLKFIFGVSAGFAVIMLLCSYFNLILFKYIPKVELVMSIIGGVYMVYLAVKIMTSKSHDEQDNKHKNISFVSGLVLQFINPKVILYGITTISTFIIPSYRSSFSLLLFSLFLAFVGFLATSCWALFGALFQKFLAKYRKPFNLAMGLLLIYSALSLFY